MKKKILALLTAVLVGSNVLAFAEVTSVKVSPNGIQVNGRTDNNKQGTDFSVDLYDATMYNADMPVTSLVHRGQGTSSVDGWWSYNIGMKNKRDGRYILKSADGSSGNLTEKGVLFENIKGTKTYSNADYTQYGEVILKNSGYIRADFEKGVTDGVAHFSFDAKTVGSDGQLVVRYSNRTNANFSNKAQVTDGLILRQDGIFAVFNELNNWNFTEKTVLYQKDVYQHIDVWIDMLKNRIYTYFNNKLISTTPVCKDLNPLRGIILAGTGTSVYGSAAIKNLKAEIIPEYEKFSEISGTGPQYVEHPLHTADVPQSEVGNIFYNTNTKFDTTVINRENKSVSYSVKSFIINAETDEELGSKTESLNLAPNEKKSCIKSFDMNEMNRQYGLFKLKTEYTKNDDGESISFSDEVNFSVVKKAGVLNSKIGIATNYGHGYYDPDKMIPLNKNAGIATDRDYLAWVQYNKSSGWTLPDRYTRWADKTANEGIDKILQVTSVSMLESENAIPKTDDEIRDFCEYALKVAQNTDAEYLEIFNEINLSSAVTPEEYARMLIAVSDKVKQGSDKKICAMATARAGQSARTWIENVLKAIQSNSRVPSEIIDAISVHPYKLYNLSPETGTNPSNGENDGTLHDQLSFTREMLNNYGLNDAPLFATEFGWTANPAWSSWAKIDDRLTEIGQAQYSIRGLALMYNDLDKICFYTMTDLTNQGDYENHFGLVKPWCGVEIPYEAKPSYLAVSAFNSIIGNAEKKNEISSGKNHDVTFSDNTDVHILWNEDTTVTYLFNSGSKALRIYDMYGNPTVMTSADGIYNLTLSPSPIYAEPINDYTDLKLIDDSGNEITSLDGKTKVKVRAVVSTDRIDANEVYYLYCIGYADNAVKKITVKYLSGEQMKSGAIESEYSDVGGCDTVKAFLWNSKLLPLCEKVEIN